MYPWLGQSFYESYDICTQFSDEEKFFMLHDFAFFQCQTPFGEFPQNKDTGQASLHWWSFWCLRRLDRLLKFLLHIPQV